jgi:hypothetical protein
MRRAGCLREDVTDALPLGPKESSAGIVNLGGANLGLARLLNALLRGCCDNVRCLGRVSRAPHEFCGAQLYER